MNDLYKYFDEKENQETEEISDKDYVRYTKNIYILLNEMISVMQARGMASCLSPECIRSLEMGGEPVEFDFDREVLINVFAEVLNGYLRDAYKVNDNPNNGDV